MDNRGKMVKRPSYAWPVVLALGLVSGLGPEACGIDLNENLGKIRRTQVISIIANPSEVQPGGTVSLQATAVDPRKWGDGESEIIYNWIFFHLEPGSTLELAIDPTNLNLSDLVHFLEVCPQTPGCTFRLGYGNPWTLTLPDQVPGEGEDILFYSVFLLIADSSSTLEQLMAGEEVAGEYDLAAKGIRVSERPEAEKNHNPVISEIGAGPSPPVELDPVSQVFRINPEEKVFLSVAAEDQDGDELVYRWWIIDGRLEEDNLEQVEWLAPERPGQYPVFLVVRDGIGGEPQGGQDTAEIVIEIPGS